MVLVLLRSTSMSLFHPHRKRLGMTRPVAPSDGHMTVKLRL
jgi:hypothetical protein